MGEERNFGQGNSTDCSRDKRLHTLSDTTLPVTIGSAFGSHPIGFTAALLGGGDVTETPPLFKIHPPELITLRRVKIG